MKWQGLPIGLLAFLASIYDRPRQHIKEQKNITLLTKVQYSQSYGLSSGFPWGLSGKESACNIVDPWVRKMPWRRAWRPTPVSCLENPMDRGAWWATVHGVTESWTRLERLSTSIVFPVTHGCESWTLKKAERRRTDAFKLWCYRRLLRVPWTARRSNQLILKEINPEYSLEGLLLKLKPQHCGRLM